MKIKGKSIVTGPSKEEYDERMRTHVPFRNWCEFCVKGKAKADPRKRGIAEKSRIEERGIPTIGIDYTYPKSDTSKEDSSSKSEKSKEESERGMPIIVMRTDLDKWTSAFVVPQKGVCEYAVKEVARQIQNAGYNRVIFKSDQEPALKELLRAVKR